VSERHATAAPYKGREMSFTSSRLGGLLRDKTIAVTRKPARTPAKEE